MAEAGELGGENGGGAGVDMAYGKIHEMFWDDPLVRSLSDDGRMLMMYLMTCRHKNRLGCYVLDLSYGAADLQWPVIRVREALAELVASDRVRHDPSNRIVLITRFLKHNKLENHKVVTGAMSELRSLPDTPLLVELLARVEKYHVAHYVPLIEELGNRIGNGIPNDMPNPIDTVAPPIRSRSRNRNQTDNDLSDDKSAPESPDKVITSIRPNDAVPTLHQQAMPVLRELGYEAGKHDGSILKAIAKKGVGWDKLEPAVRGLAAMRDDGGLRDWMGVAPGEELSLRILYARDGPKDGARPIWNVAADRWLQHLDAQHRNERKKMPRLAV